MPVALCLQRPRIFIDTSAFIALYHRSDPAHFGAIRFRDEVLLEKSVEMFCSDYVIGETLNHLQRLVWSGELRRAEFETAGRGITAEATFQSLSIDDAINKRALEITKRFSETFSFIDATDLALMEREGIRNIFTFDEGFDRYSLRFGHQRARLSRYPCEWALPLG